MLRPYDNPNLDFRLAPFEGFMLRSRPGNHDLARTGTAREESSDTSTQLTQYHLAEGDNDVRASNRVLAS